MKARVLFLLLLIVTAAPLRAELREVQVHGKSLEHNLLGDPATREVTIYLPPSYAKEKQRRYPTLVLLHGIGDSHEVWNRRGEGSHATIEALMDRGVADGLLEELIVVMPNARTTYFGCFYTNSTVKGNWTDFIADELVAYVDANYRTQAQPERRGIAGHSMGGHGAIKLGMLRPDVFGVVYGMNSAVLGWGEDLSTANPSFQALIGVSSPEQLPNDPYVYGVIGVSQAFSPNPDNQPFLADFPFGIEGGRLTENGPGRAGWEANMPVFMAPRYVDNLRRLIGLRFDTAFVDEYAHIPSTSKELSDVLTELDVPHVFEMYNGDHRNRLWGAEGRLNTEVLPYFSRLLSATQQAEAAPSKAQALLWDAARKGKIKDVRKALKDGADVNALDTRENQNGRRALNWAAYFNHTEVIELLLEHGAGIDLVNNTGYTPLHHAVEGGAYEAAQLLVTAGADVNLANKHGVTPLRRATAEQKPQFVELLRKAGAR